MEVLGQKPPILIVRTRNPEKAAVITAAFFIPKPEIKLPIKAYSGQMESTLMVFGALPVLPVAGDKRLV